MQIKACIPKHWKSFKNSGIREVETDLDSVYITQMKYEIKSLVTKSITNI